MARRIRQWKIVVSVALGTCLFLLTIGIISAVAAPRQQQATDTNNAGTPSVQTTPTEDPTVTALNKEKLAQEVEQLHNQNFWSAWTNLATPVSILAVFGGSIFAFIRYLTDRRDAQEKELKDQKEERARRAEERFQRVVEGLGSDTESAKLGAAIMLRTFLQPGYEQFYQQAFDLVVANLRFPRAAPDQAEFSLKEALITAFKVAFPLARDELLRHSSPFTPESLDASLVQLDGAYLVGAKLEWVWMLQASLQGANLRDSKLRRADFHSANLGGANLGRADLRETTLIKTILRGARIHEADFSGADLHLAELQGAYLWKSDFSGAHLREADLSGANLREANLSRANLLGANLSKADLSGANLSETKLLVADFDEDYLRMLRSYGQAPIDAKLEGTIMKDVRGLDSTQLAEYKLRGAIIGESSTPSQDTDQDHTFTSRFFIKPPSEPPEPHAP